MEIDAESISGIDKNVVPDSLYDLFIDTFRDLAKKAKRARLHIRDIAPKA